MSISNHREAFAVGQQAAVVAKPRCQQCDGIELRRTGRFGFYQQVIAPRFGLFPWECGLCRKIYMLRQRDAGNRRQSEAAAGESAPRPIPQGLAKAAKPARAAKAAKATQGAQVALGARSLRCEATGHGPLHSLPTRTEAR